MNEQTEPILGHKAYVTNKALAEGSPDRKPTKSLDVYCEIPKYEAKCIPAPLRTHTIPTAKQSESAYLYYEHGRHTPTSEDPSKYKINVYFNYKFIEENFLNTGFLFEDEEKDGFFNIRMNLLHLFELKTHGVDTLAKFMELQVDIKVAVDSEAVAKNQANINAVELDAEMCHDCELVKRHFTQINFIEERGPDGKEYTID